MRYTKELKKFANSQYIYSAIRVALAIVIPSVILAYFGLLKEFFLFPLGTSFVGLTDMPGPTTRRRNSLILAILSFICVMLIASLVKDYPILVYTELVLFGMFFTLVGVYGLRFAAVGSLSLVVLAIFIDGHLTNGPLFQNLIIFAAGCVWFLIVFMVVTTLQPYKLASQMIGENYLELSKFLEIKAKFYHASPDFNSLMREVMAQQVVIKNLQEETRETVFKTRLIVNESTTTSRLLMLTFLNSLDLHEKLMTSENDYQKLQLAFSDTTILERIYDYLLLISEELENIGIALQSGQKATPVHDLTRKMDDLYAQYLGLRQLRVEKENFDHFIILRQILKRITEIKDDVSDIYLIFSQDSSLATSLSTGLDLNKFVPKAEKLRLSVFRNNISLKSAHFRHAVRLTTALVLGYTISQLSVLEIGHSYWILITIIAIIRPAYATTKHRNLLRLYGTIVGAVIAYILLQTISNATVGLAILLLSMILCFTFLKDRYFWSVLFMTIYIFMSFNYLNPGNIDLIFKDRIIDTVIAGGVTFLVTYFLLPVWEHTKNLDFMKASAKGNLNYFNVVISHFTSNPPDLEQYRICRKDAMIALANLSDNFQRMISDPKNQQKKLELVHQFVNTSHLITAYIASLSQYTKSNAFKNEIDFESWKLKISAELQQILFYLNKEGFVDELNTDSTIEPDDIIDELVKQRHKKLETTTLLHLSDDPSKVARLTEVKNAKEILELLYDVAREQRKVTEEIYKVITTLQ